MAAQDIYERLHEDHEKHKQLIAQIEQTSGDSSERRELFKQLKTDVMGHSAAEEETLYSTLLGISDTRQKTEHATRVGRLWRHVCEYTTVHEDTRQEIHMQP